MNGPAQAARSPTAALFGAVVGIALLCAVLIVGVYEATAGRIAENKARALRAAVTTVMPQARRLRALAVDADGALEDVDPGSQELPVFVGYGEDGGLVGAAITAAGMGYQDTIRLIYAYSFQQGAVVALRILQSLETPGLGDRIETEPHFTKNFERLDVALNATGSGLLHRIETVAQGAKQEAWQIDGITGATISSKAVGAILDSSAETWVPLLVRQREQLSSAPARAED